MIKRCEHVKVQLVDIPGLNDSRTKDIYFKHLEQIFEHLSVIMLIFDINSAMNTDDELQILKKVVELASKAHADTGLEQRLFVIANKCDEMTADSKGELCFVEPEDAGLYEQLKDKVDAVIKDTHPTLNWSMVKISAQNSFIYNSCLNHIADQLEKKIPRQAGSVRVRQEVASVV